MYIFNLTNTFFMYILLIEKKNIQEKNKSLQKGLFFYFFKQKQLII